MARALDLAEHDEYHIITDTGTYREKQYKDEGELERLTVVHAKEVFGEDAIYFDIKEKVRSKLRPRITDGLLLDFRNKKSPRIWIVEYELGSHNLERDVIPQLRGFVKAFQNEETLAVIRDSIYNGIRSDREKLARFKELAGADSEIYYVINKALHRVPQVLVVFDVLYREIGDAIDESDLGDGTKLMEFMTFEKDGKFVHFVNPLLPLRSPTRASTAVGAHLRSKAGGHALQEIREVVSTMKDGKNYSEACALVASKRGITQQSVRDKTTRKLGLSTVQFMKHFKDGTLSELLKTKYPDAEETN